MAVQGSETEWAILKCGHCSLCPPYFPASLSIQPSLKAVDLHLIMMQFLNKTELWDILGIVLVISLPSQAKATDSILQRSDMLDCYGTNTHESGIGHGVTNLYYINIFFVNVNDNEWKIPPSITFSHGGLPTSTTAIPGS